MIQDIINGIVKAITTEYSGECRVYTESVEQGLKEPCFSILCLNPTNTKQVGRRYMRDNLFDIMYFPSTDEPMSECLQMSEFLFDVLDSIQVGDRLLHGSDMNGEVVDGVLHFKVTYRHFAMVNSSEDTMERMDANNITGKE